MSTNDTPSPAAESAERLAELSAKATQGAWEYRDDEMSARSRDENETLDEMRGVIVSANKSIVVWPDLEGSGGISEDDGAFVCALVREFRSGHLVPAASGGAEQDTMQALRDLRATLPTENPGPAFDEYGYRSQGDYGDVAADGAAYAEWCIAEKLDAIIGSASGGAAADLARVKEIASDLSRVIVETANELGCERDNEAILSAVDKLKADLARVEAERDEALSNLESEKERVKRLWKGAAEHMRKRAEAAEAALTEAKAERDAARKLAYDLKFAIAGGEDAPGAAEAVTVEDVERWQREDRQRVEYLESQLTEAKAAAEGMRASENTGRADRSTAHD